jgi:hypothetical protein
MAKYEGEFYYFTSQWVDIVKFNGKRSVRSGVITEGMASLKVNLNPA